MSVKWGIWASLCLGKTAEYESQGQSIVQGLEECHSGYTLNSMSTVLESMQSDSAKTSS